MNDFDRKVKLVILPNFTALKNHLDTHNLKSHLVYDATFWEEEFVKNRNYFTQLRQNLPEIFGDFPVRDLPKKKEKAMGEHDAYTALSMSFLQKDVNLAISLLQHYLADMEHPTAKVFISHGPETSVLPRIEQFIRDLGLIPIVAEKTASEGQDIRPDVEAKMRGCTCAIILAEIDPNNPTVNKTRENVLIEAEGARNILGNLIWLKQEEVKLPSLNSATIWESFTPDCLEKAFAKIVRELRAFGLLR